MKIIVAGSRDIGDRGAVARAIKSSPFNITEILSGNARGVDTIAENYAFYESIPVKLFPADWDKYGKPAGAIRNRQMGEQADGLIAVWDGESKGTRNMIEIMNELGKPVHLYLVKRNKNV